MFAFALRAVVVICVASSLLMLSTVVNRNADPADRDGDTRVAVFATPLLRE
jgi:hypothetical protein